MKLRIATCKTLPEPDQDERPLMAALVASGYDPVLLGWEDPDADWDAPIPTVIRSTWSYPNDPEAFEAWLARIAAAAPVCNPPDIIRGNMYKRYLLGLAARGVPVVPTTLVELGGTADLAAAFAGVATIVVKPEVGAGSKDTRRFAPGDPAAVAHLEMITQRRAALVQAYVDSVDEYGERSLVWIGGSFSHAIRKTPRFADDAEHVTGPVAIADDERVLAHAALAPFADRLVYARVDVARDAAGKPMVMELEMIEPSLFFFKHPPAAFTFVDAVTRWLDRV